MAVGRVGSAGFHQAYDCRGSRTHLTHFLKVKGCLFLLFCWCIYCTALPPYPQSCSSLIFVAAATYGENRAPFPPPSDDRKDDGSEDIGTSGRLLAQVDFPVGDIAGGREDVISSPHPVKGLRTHLHTTRGVAGYQSPTPMSKTSPAAGPAKSYDAREEEEAFSRMMRDKHINAKQYVEASSPWGGEEGGEKRASRGESLTAVGGGSADRLQPQKNEDRGGAKFETSPQISTALGQKATQQDETGVEGRRYIGTQPAFHTVGPSRTITAREESGRTGELPERRQSSRNQSVIGQGLKGRFGTIQSRKKLAKRLAPIAAALLLGLASFTGYKLFKKKRREATPTRRLVLVSPSTAIAANPSLMPDQWGSHARIKLNPDLDISYPPDHPRSRNAPEAVDSGAKRQKFWEPD